MSDPLAIVESTLKGEASDAGEAAELIQSMEIVTAEDVEFAAEVLADAKGHWQRLEKMKKGATKPMNEALKQVRGWFKPAQDFYADCEVTLKAKLATYHESQETARRAALAEAGAAAQGGTASEVVTALKKLGDAEEPDVGGLSYRESWGFEVTDPRFIPREFLMVNEEALRLHAVKHKENADVPGVRFFKKTTVASKSRNA